MPATVNVGGMSQSYDNSLKRMRDTNQWMKDQTILNSVLNINLISFNSSNKPASNYIPATLNGIESHWADNQTFTTLRLPNSEDKTNNVQLPLPVLGRLYLVV